MVKNCPVTIGLTFFNSKINQYFLDFCFLNNETNLSVFSEYFGVLKYINLFLKYAVYNSLSKLILLKISIRVKEVQSIFGLFRSLLMQ